MRKFHTSLDRLLRGDRDWHAGETNSAGGMTLPWLGLCALAAACAILACVTLATWSPREGVLLAAVAVLALATYSAA